MAMKIALAGNPNSGKTTLFNGLTGSNQYVGNWPGVTVEKKEGKLKGHKDVIIQDLPGIYSLSPYTLEEVVSRNYLVEEKPDVILNIVDGTNIERNLYLTTQLAEVGVPMVIALNMADLLQKRGDKIDIKKLSDEIGCPVVEISALKGTGTQEAAKAAIQMAQSGKKAQPLTFSEDVEKALSLIQEVIRGSVEENHLRWYTVKLFERDEKALEKIALSDAQKAEIEKAIAACEQKLDDDSESIITDLRYQHIGEMLSGIAQKKKRGALSTSDKIDRIVTNRWLGLPIFALVMFLVYYISMVGIGASLTDWVNDNLFGDGFHLFGNGAAEYSEAAEEYGSASLIVDGYEAYTRENGAAPSGDFLYEVEDEETLEVTEETATLEDYQQAASVLEKYGEEEPDPADYGTFVPSIPDLVSTGLENAGAADWLSGLIVDGIVAGVGAVLGFVPQMLVLFLFLAFLESCGYMARIAFVLDRVFRKFGLSGKSFIPMLVGTGCGIPGIMASRTIENERDRRMTIMTTTFIPCGAKVPFIGMIAGAIFGGSPWIATSAYFIGIAAIIISGIMLKKTKMFAGDPAPFVMELPAYHWPTLGGVLRPTWERGWSFIKKAGTIILLSTILVWFTTYFGFTADGFRMLGEEEMDQSLLAAVGNAIAWIFAPLGWGNWQAAVASITGLVAKENIVGTMGILYPGKWPEIAAAFTQISGFSFLVFNLLCAPCFAAIGAIKREMNNPRWTWFAVAYQCGFAYAIALMVNQFGNAIAGNANLLGLIFAIIVLGGLLYLLLRPYREAGRRSNRVTQNISL